MGINTRNTRSHSRSNRYSATVSPAAAQHNTELGASGSGLRTSVREMARKSFLQEDPRNPSSPPLLKQSGKRNSVATDGLLDLNGDLKGSLDGSSPRNSFEKEVLAQLASLSEKVTTLEACIRQGPSAGLLLAAPDELPPLSTTNHAVTVNEVKG